MSRKKLNIEQKNTTKWDNSLRRISGWDQEKLAEAKIMVVGAGALGNEVIKNLTLLNIGHLLIVDFDTIEYSNLSRSILFRSADCHKVKSTVAAERVKEINPNVKVQAMFGDIAYDIGLGVFRRMDVVIGCLDNRVARLFINRHCYKVGKAWVDGAIENLSGQLDVFKAGISCYECQLKESDWEDIRFRESCTDVAKRNATYGRIPTTPISASIIGAMQTQEALKIYYGNEKNSLAGQRFKYGGMSNMMLTYGAPPPKSDCISHASWSEIIEAPALSCQNSIAETLEWLKKKFNTETVKINLDYNIATELYGEKSEKSHDILMPKFRLSNEILSQYEQEPGEIIYAPLEKQISCLDANFPKLDMSLQEAGIPPLQILEVEVGDDILFVELTGDIEIINFQ